MRALQVYAKGSLIALLLVILLLPELVVSAPKVARNEGRTRKEGNSINHFSSYSENNELGATEIDETWYPAVDISNDYYDHNEEDKESRSQETETVEDNYDTNSKPEDELEVSSSTSTSTSSPTAPTFQKNYTTFCEEELGICEPDEDNEDEDDIKDHDQTNTTTESTKSTSTEMQEETTVTVDDLTSRNNLEKKRNETSHLNLNSTYYAEDIKKSNNLVESNSTKSEIAVAHDLETELDCLIEDVHLILQHAKEFVRDSNISHDPDDSIMEKDKLSEQSSLSETSEGTETNYYSTRDRDILVDLEDDKIEDEDLMESLQTEVQTPTQSETISAEVSSEEKFTENSLSTKQLEEIIKKEHAESNSHATSGSKHHVKEHRSIK